jgi:hypothetical protein
MCPDSVAFSVSNDIQSPHTTPALLWHVFRPVCGGGLSSPEKPRFATMSMPLKAYHAAEIEPVPQFLRLLVYIRLLISRQDFMTLRGAIMRAGKNLISNAQKLTANHTVILTCRPLEILHADLPD